MEEIWKDAVGWEGIYKVSSNGNIFCCDRIARSGKHIKSMNKKPILKKSGYLGTSFYDSNTDRIKNVLIHRIVAEAFIPNPENKPCIDHINTNKMDNRVCNLRWCTHKENSNNPLSLKALSVSGSIAQNKPDTIIRKRINAISRPVCQYSINGAFIRSYISIHEAYRTTNTCIANICNCCNRRVHTANGFIWRYDGDLDISYNKKTTARPVVQLSIDNVLIRDYQSMEEARLSTGINKSDICNCCKGKYKMAGGYKWKYKEDYHE